MTAFCWVEVCRTAALGKRGGEHQTADRNRDDDRQHDRNDAAHGVSPVAFANSVRICNITIAVEITSAKAGTSVAEYATVGLALGWAFLRRRHLP